MWFDDGAATWHVALMLWRSIRLREGDKKKKKIKELPITGFAVSGWLFDATLGSCCSEQREGCVREQKQCQCDSVWIWQHVWCVFWFVFAGKTFIYYFFYNLNLIFIAAATIPLSCIFLFFFTKLQVSWFLITGTLKHHQIIFRQKIK